MARSRSRFALAILMTMMLAGCVSAPTPEWGTGDGEMHVEIDGDQAEISSKLGTKAYSETLGLMGCATVGNYPGPSDYPAKWEWQLVESKTDPSIRQFQKLFFNAPDMNEALRTQLAQMLVPRVFVGIVYELNA